MRTDRTSSTVHLLRILLWVAAILPASLLAYASFVNYQALEDATADRLERTLDVLQEHTLRVFQTVDRTIAEIDEVLRHDSDDSIRAREERFHQRLKRTQTTLPLTTAWIEAP